MHAFMYARTHLYWYTHLFYSPVKFKPAMDVMKGAPFMLFGFDVTLFAINWPVALGRYMA